MFYIKNRKRYSMKKILRIDLEYNWVLSRIDDAKYPVEVIKDKFVKGKVERVSDSYLHLTLSVDENDYEKLKNKIASFFAYKYGKTSVYALNFSDKEPATEEESEQKRKIRKNLPLTTHSDSSIFSSAQRNTNR